MGVAGHWLVASYAFLLYRFFYDLCVVWGMARSFIFQLVRETYGSFAGVYK